MGRGLLDSRSTEVLMRLIGLVVVLSASLVAPTDAAEPYTEEAISLPSGGLTLRAVLARPYGDGPSPPTSTSTAE